MSVRGLSEIVVLDWGIAGHVTGGPAVPIGADRFVRRQFARGVGTTSFDYLEASFEPQAT
jgi:hypothetical protein